MVKDLINKHISNKLTPIDLILLREAFEKNSEEDFYEILHSIWESIDTSTSNTDYSDLLKSNLQDLKNRI